jgi:hypothetical protein
MRHVTMRGTDIRGSLTVNAELLELNLVDTSVRGMGAPPGVALTKANITGTGMGGAVPEWLLNAPKLEELIISNNSFSSMPSKWYNPNLRVLRASANSLPVRSSPSCLKNTSSLCLMLRVGSARCLLRHDAHRRNCAACVVAFLVVGSGISVLLRPANSLPLAIAAACCLLFPTTVALLNIEQRGSRMVAEKAEKSQ